ncbi:FAD/NAD(P)-binding protein [Dyella sp.]|jgi:uncharacterized NAD(P)/FAD-binding protein YdhS|uniref:FAD/NAD(P)-binding protein n=1 Tax=Dyella sp. TaxID=1869338 RepID=UPI002D779E6D|nr:FAD/NAD(P)-binding protein [Dyella sp.]HET6433592.1 FAD/NAD(P)-binding protein [Dyella sp.]
MSDIAIVGGGAAGAAVFGELLRRPRRSGTLHWITGCPSPGVGVAYATGDERHLLNVRAAGMGLFAEHRDDFLQHAGRSIGPVSGGDFLPRRVFGDFVQAQIQARMMQAHACGVDFRVHHPRAVSLAGAAHGGYRIVLGDGEALDVDTVVLALGALAPRALKTVSAAALASPAYVLDPWGEPPPAPAPRRVLVIGTGLTAVDTIISASTRWPEAALVAVSRHGLLPLQHPAVPVAPYPFQHDLNNALLACDGAAAMSRLVREAIADPACANWRAVIDGMRPINARLWQGLAPAQRRQFLRHLRWVWEASRHRVAPASADAVQALLATGRLQVHAARVLAVDGSGPLTVTVRHRTSQEISAFEADRVVQATGLDTAAAYASEPLLAHLLRSGLAAPDPLQLGLAACPDGQLLDAQGRPRQGLYGLGALLRGSLWECTAMPEIRAAAHQLAQRLAPTDEPRDEQTAV